MSSEVTEFELVQKLPSRGNDSSPFTAEAMEQFLGRGGDVFDTLEEDGVDIGDVEVAVERSAQGTVVKKATGWYDVNGKEMTVTVENDDIRSLAYQNRALFPSLDRTLSPSIDDASLTPVERRDMEIEFWGDDDNVCYSLLGESAVVEYLEDLTGTTIACDNVDYNRADGPGLEGRVIQARYTAPDIGDRDVVVEDRRNLTGSTAERYPDISITFPRSGNGGREYIPVPR